MEKQNGTAATRAKNKYNAKAYDRLIITVPKGHKETIDATAKKHGYKSRNEFILAAIKSFTDSK